MKEKLIIKNFGPIKSVELELGRFNVLIGENATGKSVVAKVLAVCRFFSYLLDYDLFPKAFEEGLNSRGLNEFIQENSYIFYECEHYSFKAERGLKKETDRGEDGIVTAEYELPVFFSALTPRSQEFINLLKELDGIIPRKPKSQFYYYSTLDWTIPTSFFQNDVSAVLDNPFFVPTERGLQSIFSLGKNSVQNLSDALFNQLAELDQIARRFKNETKIEPLNITYKNLNGKGFIRHDNDDKYYSLFNAASGFQSTIPIVLLVKYYIELRKKPKTFIVEEPELNLFPTAQNKLMQYLVDKTMNYGNSMLLTTHSPYILSSVNNLIYAHKIGQIHPEEVKKLLPESFWLNPDDIFAYRMLSNGTAKTIIDEELEEIAVEEIDEVSRNLNAEYDDILSIKFGKNEKTGRLSALQ